MGRLVAFRWRRTAVVFALALGMLFVMAASAGAVSLTGIVTGTVTDADTGLPIVGAPIHAYDPDTWETVAVVYTDENGVYTFETPIASTAWNCDPEGYPIAWRTQATPFGVTTTYDFVLNPDVPSFSGIVKLANGLPAAGSDVVVLQQDESDEGLWYFDDWTSTDENGDYTIYNVKGGDPMAVQFHGYDEGRWAGEYYDDADSLDQAVIWESDLGEIVGPHASIDATLEAVAGVEGFVTDGADPVAGAIVTLERRPFEEVPAVSEVLPWEYVASTATNVDGEYSFPGPDMPGGYDYRVSVAADGLLPKVSDTFSYSKGFYTETFNVALDPAPPLATGTVTCAATGEPMEGVAVHLADPETGGYLGLAYTDADGKYTLPYRAEYGALPFDFKLKAYMDGYKYSWQGPYTYDGVTTIVKDFKLAREGRFVSRVAGSDRYAVAVTLARMGWDPQGNNTWPSVTNIIVANGETGREADPLCAAPLSGVLNAPVLLVNSSGLPLSTKNTIAAIAAKNPGVKVYLIGGTASVPDSVWASIRSIKGVSPTKTRIAGVDRYATSVAIAKKVNALGLGLKRAESGVMLVAGDNPAAFYDALAASPGAYSYRQPMMAVKKDSVPPVVKTALNNEFKTAKRYIVSSPTYISAAAVAQVGGESERLATSSNRYTAAAQIAGKMCDEGWVYAGNAGLAATLPDALTGGTFFGKVRGVMLFTDSTTKMQAAPKYFIETHDADIEHGWVIGGTKSVTDAVKNFFYTMMNPNA